MSASSPPFHSWRLTFTFLYACVSEHLCVTIFWQLIRGSRLLTDFMSDHRAFDRWTLIHSKTCRCNSPVSKSHFSVRSPTQKSHTHTYRYNISFSQLWWLIYYTVACLRFQRCNINSHQTDVLYEVWERWTTAHWLQKSQFSIPHLNFAVVKANITVIPSSFTH